MEKHIFLKLLDKYLNGNATTAEEGLLYEYYRRLDERSKKDLSDAETQALHDLMLSNILNSIHEAPVIPIHKSFKWWYAAAVVLILLGGAYVMRRSPNIPVQLAKNDILPGHNQATLTLANGKKIILTRGLSGKLAQQGNTSINVSNAVAYIPGSTDQSIAYNTLSTATGEESPYPLILSDGTKVWLDAESSITYPTQFTKDRLVTITGQAYFEVVHDAAHPFKISVKDIIVEDIGTKFNVNSYDANIKTTLLEGAVKISQNERSVILRPGQEASNLQIKEGDTEESVAWKNGYFRFNDENIQDIMRELSRWYNIDVQYSRTLPAVGFNAHISRYKNISQVLKVLSLTNSVHFTIEGRRVMVTN